MGNHQSTQQTIVLIVGMDEDMALPSSPFAGVEPKEITPEDIQKMKSTDPTIAEQAGRNWETQSVVEDTVGKIEKLFQDEAGEKYRENVSQAVIDLEHDIRIFAGNMQAKGAITETLKSGYSETDMETLKEKLDTHGKGTKILMVGAFLGQGGDLWDCANDLLKSGYNATVVSDLALSSDRAHRSIDRDEMNASAMSQMSHLHAIRTLESKPKGQRDEPALQILKTTPPYMIDMEKRHVTGRHTDTAIKQVLTFSDQALKDQDNIAPQPSNPNDGTN